MKKVLILFIMFFTFGIICAYIMQTNKGQENLTLSELDKKNYNVIVNEVNRIEEDVLQASSREERLSPNAVLTLKKYYKSCGHTVIDETIIPEEAVNKNATEIKNMYSNWELLSFNTHEIILYNVYEDNCHEHYVLRNKDGYIYVYTIDKDEKESLYEKTTITTSYLPTEDVKKLNDGIKAIGKEELNSILEDYE